MFIFLYKLGQTLGSLTSVKPNMQSLLLLLASCLAESFNTPHGESSVTKFWGRRENLPRPWFEQCEVTIIAFGTGLRMTLGRGCFHNFGFTLPSQPHPGTQSSTPEYSPFSIPFYIATLVHRSASASSTSLYTALEPVHRRHRTRSLFPGTIFHGLGSVLAPCWASSTC